MKKYTYFAPWSEKPAEADNYFLWGCDTKNEIIIVQYKDNLNYWFVEYSDQWTIPNAKRMPSISIKCASLHDAKLMGDVAAKSCEKWINRPVDNSDLI